MKGKKEKKYQFSVLIIFVACTILSFAMAIHILNTRVENKKNSAKYTAESTTRRIKAEIDTYLVAVDILENYLLTYGEKELLSNFEHLSETMLDKEGIIKGIELAKDGVISRVYPQKGNDVVLGFDLLKDPHRKVEANLAKDTGDYTMVGPYGLRQSYEGVLLLNPIYTNNDNGKKDFWGFSLIVIDWKKFIKKINLERLEETGYLYKIWRRDPYSNEQIILVQSHNEVKKDAIKVVCTVPNDTWHVEIAPKKGWYVTNIMLQQILIAIIIPILGTVGIWLYLRNKQQENMYNIRLEQARNKAELASEAKTRFLCNMSHDIRTPMNAVLGFTKIASENINNVNMVRDSLKKIDISGRHLLNLINDVLNFSSIESGIMKSKISENNIYDLGNDLVAIFEQGMKEKNIDFSVKYNIKDNNINCDAHHLREICVNLISNALKFTLDGGKVICEFKQLDFVSDSKCIYQIEVRDNGIGMSKEFQQIQYNSFEREGSSTVQKTQGTGLGLSIVKRLVEVLDGSIYCESEVGRGTTYRLNFEFEVVKNSVVDEKEYNKKESVKGKKILLVEDVELNREIAEYILEDMGFEVEYACDGKEALDKINDAAADYYDIVLMDIQMPVMNGYEATRRIREMSDVKKSSIPIYAMTANAFEEDKKCAIEAGMNGHFAKPLETDKIYKILSTC